MFAAPELLDVSLNQWLRHLPRHIVEEHLNFSPEEIDKIPEDNSEVI